MEALELLTWWPGTAGALNVTTADGSVYLGSGYALIATRCGNGSGGKMYAFRIEP
jgi:hypothetical protein